MSFLPEEYANADVTIQEVSKNNNQKFHAICIKRPEDRIVPNVYLEDYYRTYEDDGNMENILTAIARIYKKNIENNENLLPFEVKDYESVKNRLYVVALNRNNNQDHLRDAVRRDIAETDITSVVRVLCTNNQEKGIGKKDIICSFTCSINFSYVMVHSPFSIIFQPVPADSMYPVGNC